MTNTKYPVWFDILFEGVTPETKAIRWKLWLQKTQSKPPIPKGKV